MPKDNALSIPSVRSNEFVKAGHASSNSASRLNWLDELRGLAALLVMLGHYRFLYEYGNKFVLVDIFPRGVQLFYILSGFILYFLYSNKLNSTRGYLEFIIKRFFRIAPLFYFVTIASFVLFYKDIYNSFFNLISHLFIIPMGLNRNYINGIIGVEWSIFVEFTFYIIFPAVIILYKKYRHWALLVATFLSLFQSFYVYKLGLSVTTREFLYNLPTTQLCFFLMGIFLAELSMAHITDNFSNVFNKKILAHAGILGLITAPYLFFSFNAQLYFSLIFLALIIYGYREVNKPRFISAGLLWLGKRSYSVYLTNFVILKGLHFSSPSYFKFIVAAGVVILVSSITYKYIEVPGINLGYNMVKGLSRSKFVT